MDLEEGRMEKGMILYQSKYGAARKYAGWLREETGFEIREVKNCKIEEVLCVWYCGNIVFPKEHRKITRETAFCFYCWGIALS